MTRALVTVAAGLVRIWVWLYTSPLADAPRHARRSEIDSDLWELVHDASREGRAADALHILTRAVLGVPDDLFWAAEELPAGVRAPQLATVTKAVAILLVATGIVVTASGTTADPRRNITINVTQSGWIAVARTATEVTVAPAFGFTITNHGDRASGPLQVNALFSWSDRKPGSLGTGFSQAIGWRGLAPGSTSQPIVLYSRGGWWGRASQLRETVATLANQAALGEAMVKLYAHDGRGWTLVGEFPIAARVIQP